jgi:hypothetical protein
MQAAGCKRHSGVGSRNHYTPNCAYKVDFLEHWKSQYLRFLVRNSQEAVARAIRPWASLEMGFRQPRVGLGEANRPCYLGDCDLGKPGVI